MFHFHVSQTLHAIYADQARGGGWGVNGAAVLWQSHGVYGFVGGYLTLFGIAPPSPLPADV